MTYTKDIYVGDSNGTQVNWDAGQGAASTSPLYWIPPEDVTMKDLIMAAAPTITRMQVTRNGVPTGDMLRVAAHTQAITFRPMLNIPIRAGSQVIINQIT
jgi:hypothetical protein